MKLVGRFDRVRIWGMFSVVGTGESHQLGTSTSPNHSETMRAYFHTLHINFINERLVAYLCANGEASFTELKKQLDVTVGNLSSHVQKLEDANCVSVTKQFVNRTPRTSYQLTGKGKELFEAHIQTIESLINSLDS